jgi:hypothetical protein
MSTPVDDHQMSDAMPGMVDGEVCLSGRLSSVRRLPVRLDYSPIREMRVDYIMFTSRGDVDVNNVKWKLGRGQGR